jgi:predicted ABC-type ATPase
LPTAIILAGPNGAGKTTFAGRWFADEPGQLTFVNADEIARELGVLTGAARDMQAGRLMLERLDETVARRGNFVVEITLSSSLYAKRIERWRSLGYRIALIYLRLPSVEASLARVRGRAAAGGHSVPEADLRRRFARSLDLLERVYKPLVDDWSVFDSREGRFDLTGWSPR